MPTEPPLLQNSTVNSYGRLAIVPLAILLWASTSLVIGQTEQDLIKQRKTDLLYPLGTLIASSTRADDQMFVIGVLGPDPFEGQDVSGNAINHLDAMANASNARTGPRKRQQVVIRRFATSDDYSPCDMLIVSPLTDPHDDGIAATQRLKEARKIAENHKNQNPVLLIADTQDEASRDAPLSFYLKRDGNKVTVLLEFNPQAARELGFDEISPHLYKLIRSGLGRIIGS